MRRIVMGLLLGALAVPALAAGPVSEYFLVSGDQRRVDVVQGSNLLRTWATPDFEYPVAVASTVKTFGAVNGTTGREYDYNGNQTGNTYPNRYGTFWDGTTDGRNIYSINWDNGDVVQFDSNWANPRVLFNSGGGGNYLGITYDPTNGSLWIAQFGGGRVENRTLNGTLLSAFNSGIGNQAALALDHADNSLWLVEWTQRGDFRQFNKSGNLLSTINYPGLNGVNPLGGEFAIPEPAALALLIVGAGLLLRRR